MTYKRMTTIEYNVSDILKDSYENKIGHIPSALSLFQITKELYGRDNPIVIGKSFGAQAWFVDAKVRENFLKSGKRILSVDDFLDSTFNVKYCQQQLGLAAGFAVGFSLSHKDEVTLCVLSDADVMMKSSLDAIEFAFQKKLPIKFIVDYNKVQLFGDMDCVSYIKHLNHSFDVIKYDRNTEIILFHTKKGQGCSLMEEKPKDWHYTILSKEQYEKLE
jgi:transketolase N-terminal domain/subunit